MSWIAGESMIDETEEEFINRMTGEQKRKEQKANWEKLPESKPSWEAWKRMLGYYHSERHAWFMWEKSQQKESK